MLTGAATGTDTGRGRTGAALLATCGAGTAGAADATAGAEAVGAALAGAMSGPVACGRGSTIADALAAEDPEPPAVVDGG